MLFTSKIIIRYKYGDEEAPPANLKNNNELIAIRILIANESEWDTMSLLWKLGSDVNSCHLTCDSSNIMTTTSYESTQ